VNAWFDAQLLAAQRSASLRARPNGRASSVAAQAKNTAASIHDIAWRCSVLHLHPAPPEKAYTRPLCVAEHALLVVRVLEHHSAALGATADPQLFLAGLHGAGRSIGGRPTTPELWCWTALETFGLAEAAHQHHLLLQQAELVARLTEARDLLPRREDAGSPQPREVEPLEGVDLNDASDLGANHWRRAFLAQHQTLLAQVQR
jgi:hypothetical protein